MRIEDAVELVARGLSAAEAVSELLNEALEKTGPTYRKTRGDAIFDAVRRSKHPFKSLKGKVVGNVENSLADRWFSDAVRKKQDEGEYIKPAALAIGRRVRRGKMDFGKGYGLVLKHLTPPERGSHN